MNGSVLTVMVLVDSHPDSEMCNNSHDLTDQHDQARTNHEIDKGDDWSGIDYVVRSVSFGH